MRTTPFANTTESKSDIAESVTSNSSPCRTIDGSRVGLSFARKRTIGGRRGGGGGNFNGGDRYSRGGGGGDYDSSRSRRNYSPRQGSDTRDRLVGGTRWTNLMLTIRMIIEMAETDDDVTHARVVLFNIANGTTTNDQDRPHPSTCHSRCFFHLSDTCHIRFSSGRAVIEPHRAIAHPINNQLTLFIGKRRATLTLRRAYRVRRFRYEENDD